MGLFSITKSTFYLSGDNNHLILIELVYYDDDDDEIPLNSARGNRKIVMDYQTTNKLRYLFVLTNSKFSEFDNKNDQSSCEYKRGKHAIANCR